MSVKVIDLFCGVGGLTKGLELAGLDVVAGLDLDESCRYAYEYNNNASFIHCDITKISSDELNAFYHGNDIRVLVGCAPCQPFSKYTKRYRQAEQVNGREGDPWQADQKWRLLYSFIHIIKKTVPHIVSMENVPELANEQVFSDFIKALIDMNYHVKYSVAFCPDYGVPQNRKRLVLLASKFGEIDLIAPLYTPANYRTVRNAIAELPSITDGEVHKYDLLHNSAKLSELNYRRITQSVAGGSWRDWDTELILPCHLKTSGKGYSSVYGRMAWDKPSPTITTQFYGYGNGRFGHPEQNRALSMREGALLQSFPSDYIMYDPAQKFNRREVGTHIGNAVPVELGRAIGISILKHIGEIDD